MSRPKCRDRKMATPVQSHQARQRPISALCCQGTPALASGPRERITGSPHSGHRPSVDARVRLYPLVSQSGGRWGGANTARKRNRASTATTMPIATAVEDKGSRADFQRT